MCGIGSRLSVIECENTSPPSQASVYPNPVTPPVGVNWTTPPVFSGPPLLTGANSVNQVTQLPMTQKTSRRKRF